MIAVRRAPKSLAMPIAVSALLHVALLSTFVFLRSSPPSLLPTMYKVNLVAAPPGPRAEGVVIDEPPPVAPKKPEARSRPLPKPVAAKPVAKAAKGKAPVKATPTVAAKAPAAPPVEAPRAGGGEQGGRGADVANVSTAGIVFPYKGYLDNIVRQIALNFSPRGNVGALRAEVQFFIRRDGSVTGFRWLSRSNNMTFDFEAQGAVEAAAKAFGPLPAGFADDVLPIIFFFDPSKLR